LIAVVGTGVLMTSKAPPTIRACAATGSEQPRRGIPARPVIVRRDPSAAWRASRELTVEEVLVAPIVRRLMERDGVDPEYVGIDRNGYPSSGEIWLV
jgi:hypothetical protein